MRLAGLVGLLFLSACGDVPTNQAVPESGTFSVAMQSEDAIDGRRPILTLACGGSGASFWLELVRIPDPPPAAAYGTIKLDDHTPRRIALLWLGEDKWAPDLDAAAETELARAMLAARSVYFLGPEGTTDQPYRWDMSRLGAGVDELRQRCG